MGESHLHGNVVVEGKLFDELLDFHGLAVGVPMLPLVLADQSKQFLVVAVSLELFALFLFLQVVRMLLNH